MSKHKYFVCHLPYYKHCKSVFSKLLTCSFYRRGKWRTQILFTRSAEAEAYPRSKIPEKNCGTLKNSSVLRGTPRNSSPRPTKLLRVKVLWPRYGLSKVLEDIRYIITQGSLRPSLQRHHYREYKSKDSKEYWRSLQISKDSERSPKKRLKDIPKVFKRIQNILIGSKRFQKIPISEVLPRLTIDQS